MKIGITIILILLITALVLFLLWCGLLLPRRKHPGWEKLEKVRYAHRGLHDMAQAKPERPENSMAAFREAVAHGFGAELDVHLLADGGLAVVHDSDLTRVCGKSVLVETLRTDDLKNYALLDTKEHIPLLEDVLKLFEGNAPLIIELKVAGGNAASLTDAVMVVLKDWKGLYCIESFHPGVLLRLKKKYPQVIRGQLSANFLQAGESNGLILPLRFILTLLLTTFLTRPDFIAYKWKDRSCPSLKLMKRLYGVHEVGWTVRSKEVMDSLEAEDVVPIFENFIPAEPQSTHS